MFNKKLCSSYSFSKRVMNIIDLSTKIEIEHYKKDISDDDFDILVDRHNDYIQLLDRDEFNCYSNYLEVRQNLH